MSGTMRAPGERARCALAGSGRRDGRCRRGRGASPAGRGDARTGRSRVRGSNAAFFPSRERNSPRRKTHRPRRLPASETVEPGFHPVPSGAPASPSLAARKRGRPPPPVARGPRRIFDGGRLRDRAAGADPAASPVLPAAPRRNKANRPPGDAAPAATMVRPGESRRRASRRPTPVVFPMAGAPDDPGPDGVDTQDPRPDRFPAVEDRQGSAIARLPKHPDASKKPRVAAIAQLVEHLIRNEGVGGQNPSCGTRNPEISHACGYRPLVDVAPHFVSRHDQLRLSYSSVAAGGIERGPGLARFLLQWPSPGQTLRPIAS